MICIKQLHLVPYFIILSFAIGFSDNYSIAMGTRIELWQYKIPDEGIINLSKGIVKR